MVNVVTGLCAAPAGGSAASNDVIVQYSCDVDPTRRWTVAVRGGGFQELYNASTGLCLSPAGGSTAAGALIVQSAACRARSAVDCGYPILVRAIPKISSAGATSDLPPAERL